MMHCTMDDLVALRAGEGSVWARRHMADCASCRAELEALYQRVAQLRALPALGPARDRWPAVREALRAERRRRRRVWSLRGLAGLAAAAAVAALLVSRPFGNVGVAHAQELARAKERSAELESRLQGFEVEDRVMSGREALLAAELEDQIAVIDGQLVRLGVELAPASAADLVKLWRERVDLMEQLVTVRVTRAAYVGL